jgi:stage V sporulation protein SpoVS
LVSIGAVADILLSNAEPGLIAIGAVDVRSSQKNMAMTREASAKQCDDSV